MLREPGIICDFIGSQRETKLERFANEFAAEMMVNKDELREFLKNKKMDHYESRWGDPYIDMIKNYFKVSRDVVAISLESVGFAPQGFYKTKRAQWDKRRPYFSGLTPPRILGRTKVRRRYGELGGPYSRLLTEAYISGNISMTSLSRVLGMKIERINDFINYVKTH
jgi:Zn-dependent peptidase ImmA (M78 family)